MNALRNTIQTLCQSSNPLGRCLEYVQEDLEAMGKELEQWRASWRRGPSTLRGNDRAPIGLPGPAEGSGRCCAPRSTA